MGLFGGDWHSDISFLEAPPSASILYGAQIPAVGADTLWIDMAQAYKALMLFVNPTYTTDIEGLPRMQSAE